MPYSPRRFWAVVGVGWVVLGLAAFLYAGAKGIPAMVALPVAAAFLIEFPFYLLPGLQPKRLSNPGLLAASCVLPYLVYSLPTGEFRLAGFALLALISLLLSYWFRILPKAPAVDVLFLALAASLYLAKVFDGIYLSPIPRLQLSTLGHIMLIRTCAFSVLSIRGGVEAEFRFLPTGKEILEGLRWFAFMLPAVSAALRAVGLWHFRDHPNLLAGIATFFGILWVTALSEEFVFRGLLQEWLASWTGNGFVALLAASLLFGASHLGFAHIFPNWRFAVVAVVFGIFCGLCWRKNRSVQASMVTHAIGATVYRVFFQ